MRREEKLFSSPACHLEQREGSGGLCGRPGRCFVLIGFLFFSGCGHLPGKSEKNQSERQSWQKSELYFGLDRTSTAQWKSFVDEVILPKFPQGFTILDAEGYWLPWGFSKSRHEYSKVLVLVHARSAESENDLERIRNEYKRRFHQESVLRVDYPARVSF